MSDKAMTNPILKAYIIEPSLPSYSGTCYAHINLYFMYCDNTNREVLSHYTKYDYEMAGRMDYRDLCISCQIDSSEASPDTGDFSYAWKIAYRDTGSIDLLRAEQMYKTLQKITKKYDQFRENLGRPQSFGQYVSFLANALKIKYIVFNTKDSDDYEEHLVFFKVADASFVIDDKVKELKRECLKKAGHSTALIQ